MELSCKGERPRFECEMIRLIAYRPKARLLKGASNRSKTLDKRENYLRLWI